MQILITRPQSSAEALAKVLAPHAIESIFFPVIEILPAIDPGSLQAAIKKIAQADMIIFVSPMTVHALFSQYSRLVFDKQMLLAVGKGTAQALAEYENHEVIYPAHADSENLLGLPQLQNVKNKKIIIFAGEAGKTLLENTLQQRGAIVKMAYTHRRVLPKYDNINWDPRTITLSLCVSEQSLQNFYHLIEQLQLHILLDKPLLVISDIMKEQARQLGFRSAIIQAAGATNPQLLAAILSYQTGVL